MLSSERMAVVDANASYLGVPERTLMENAGKALAREAMNTGDEPDEALVIAGRGNNGGDAFVASRFLESDAEVTTALVGRASNIHTEEARANFDALTGSEANVVEVRDSTGLGELPFDADVVVDGMLGTGVTGELREPVASAVECVNSSDAAVVSADFPTGVDADATTPEEGAYVDADRVVAFHDEKPAHAWLNEETEVAVVDIGIPDAAEEFVGEGDLRILGRDPDSHKGDHGKVLVVGGGPYTGAPALTAGAALRSGCDLVTVATPESAAETVASYSPNLIVRPLEGDHLGPNHVGRVVELAEGADITVLGPGLGSDGDTLDAVREILPRLDCAVVDADALREVDAADGDVIATPHAGELARHVDVPDGWRERRDVVEEFSREHGIVTLLKGRYDVISDGETTRVSRTGTPAMTVGGTGDVLAGVCASLAARLDTFDAACVGAFANGRAGEVSADERGNCITATDLTESLPYVLGPE